MIPSIKTIMRINGVDRARATVIRKLLDGRTDRLEPTTEVK